jgi:hypothetical protein
MTEKWTGGQGQRFFVYSLIQLLAACLTPIKVPPRGQCRWLSNRVYDWVLPEHIVMLPNDIQGLYTAPPKRPRAFAKTFQEIAQCIVQAGSTVWLV